MSAEARARIDWHDQAVVLDDCTALLHFLANSDHQAHYSFAQLWEATGFGDQAVLARSLLYLCSASNPVLDMVLLLADGDHARELEPDEYEIHEDGSFTDAYSGVEISQSEIYVAYDLIADRASLLEADA